ncbi:DUF3006 domain-containing protein [Clostridium niameyense]|uniref:DUF3006 domain-containing protein n=1 Tax=Clostridium niameyense TaxID=1622073 RepID=A0A6M0RCA3_9CLOT|nr:DUF3006 domain-containing protein [Clostridium niameyense]NEZ47886.1 DUF3006 domain-containing protein [Clostridium niameyense]
MKGIIDRFEEEFVVVELESGETMNIPINKMPKGIREGVVINIFGRRISIDESETKKLSKDIDKLIEDMWDE